MLQDVTIRSWTSFLRRHIRPKATAATKIANLQTVVSDAHFELTPTLGQNIFYCLMLTTIRIEHFLLDEASDDLSNEKNVLHGFCMSIFVTSYQKFVLITIQRYCPYTVLCNVHKCWPKTSWVGNQGNHHNFDPSLLPKNLWLLFVGLSKKKFQNGWLKKNTFFKTINSQYFFAKLSGIGPWISRINWCEGHWWLWDCLM